MFCFVVKRVLSPYVDGRVRPKLTEKITRHLGSCSACERQHRELLDGLRLLKSAERPSLPNDLWERVVARVRQKKSASSLAVRLPESRILTWTGYAVAAASILLALYVGFLPAQPSDGPISPEHFAIGRLRDLANGLPEDPVSLDSLVGHEAFYRAVVAKERSQ